MLCNSFISDYEDYLENIPEFLPAAIATV